MDYTWLTFRVECNKVKESQVANESKSNKNHPGQVHTPQFQT